MFPLPRGGALKLTTARWRTPLGRSVAATGLRPDLVRAEPDPVPEGAADPLLREALQALQSETRRRD